MRSTLVPGFWHLFERGGEHDSIKLYRIGPCKLQRFKFIRELPDGERNDPDQLAVRYWTVGLS